MASEVATRSSDTTTDANANTPNANTDTDSNVHVLLALEYHGTNYGGWQRQGGNNNVVFPSVQGTLEQAATMACQVFVDTTNSKLQPGTAIMSTSSGRTDRGVHALDHQCLLRLPFAQHLLGLPESSLSEFLVGSSTSTTSNNNNHSCSSSQFLTELNKALPSDIFVKTCQTITKKQRKQLRFYRKQYTYLLQIAPQNNTNTNRPWPYWNDYTYFVKDPLNVAQMQQALHYMVGRHDFESLACQRGRHQTVRTLHQGTIHTVTLKNEKDSQETQLPWFQRAYRRPEDRNRKKRKKESDSGFGTKNKRQNNGGSSPSTHASSSTSENINKQEDTMTTISTLDDNHDHHSESVFVPPHYGATPSANEDEKKKNDNDDTNKTHDKKRPKVRENQHQNQPQDYTFLKIVLEGNGFLRHQVRRMVSVLVKVGLGIWEPEIVQQLLNGVKDTKFLQGQSLAPARGLWKTRVWVSMDNATTNSNGGDVIAAILEEEDDDIEGDE